MVLEDILLALAVGVVLLVVGWPVIRLLQSASTLRRRDPLAEAKARLKAAQLEAEAAKLNREADRIYERIYDETLTKDDDGRDRGAAEREADEVQPPTEEDKRHGKD